MTSAPKTVTTVAQLRKAVAQWRNGGERIALVPTMGALHEGHLSLVRLAGKKADRVVVSIFVNPAQFAPNEDLETYPRDEAGDMAKLHALGTDLVFAPSAKEMYPPGFSTSVKVGGLSEGLCGRSRPHFFGGVATVVAKLLLQCLPDIAVFGEKDYQQLLVIRRMARDLDIPVEVLGGPIIREKDGLAMSSRNAYLSTKERATAPLLYQTITQIAGDLSRGGETSAQIQSGIAALSDVGFKVDYLEVRNAEDLTPLAGTVAEPARVFAAVMLGKTRLIDNVAVPRSK
jgi:pantoate--beta-alanine ligase